MKGGAPGLSPGAWKRFLFFNSGLPGRGAGRAPSVTAGDFTEFLYTFVKKGIKGKKWHLNIFRGPLDEGEFIMQPGATFKDDFLWIHFTLFSFTL